MRSEVGDERALRPTVQSLPRFRAFSGTFSRVLRFGDVRLGTAAVIVAFPALLLAFLVGWQHGLLSDDYVAAHTGIPVAIQPRELGAVVNNSMAYGVAHLDFLTRLVEMLAVGANAYLLGWLVVRSTRSPLAGIVSGWLFVAPVWAYEATMWATASMYLLAASLLLIYLHMIWSALTAKTARSLAAWTGLAVVSSCAGALTMEQAIVPAVLLPLLWMPALPGHLGWGARIRRTLVVWAPPAFASTALSWLVYTTLPRGFGRGHVVSSVPGLLDRANAYWSRLGWLTWSDGWGRPLFSAMWRRGVAELSGDPVVWLLVAAAAGLLVLLIVVSGRGTNLRPPILPGVMTLIAGAVLAVVSLLVPGALIAGQQLEVRMLYLPTLGMCMVVGAGVSTLAGRYALTSRAVLSVAGVLLIWCALTNLGAAAFYGDRSRLDNSEVAAFKAAIPGRLLPASGYIVPLDLEPDQRRTYSGKMLHANGVFQNDFASSAAIRPSYPDKSMAWLSSNYWGGLHLAHRDQGNLDVNGVSVPSANTLMFTFRNGRVVVIDRLVLVEGGGRWEYRFPVARLMEQAGDPALQMVACDDAQTFAISDGCPAGA